MTYRTEDTPYEKLVENEKHNAEQSVRLHDFLKALLVHPDECCRNCGHRPIAFAAMGGLCVECSDYILD